MPYTNPETAKIKLVIYLKNGQTLRWLNFDKYNHRSREFLMNDMERRMNQNPDVVGKYNSAIFYDNQTKNEIKRI